MNADFRFALLIAFALCAGSAVAGPLDEIKAASGLEGLDAGRLKKGEIASARGTKGNFARGVYVESCYYVKRPMAVVGAALLQWDPTKHPEDEVAAYQLYRTPATADFGQIARLKPEHSPDQWMLDRSAAVKAGKTGDLHLTPAEAAVFREETGGASVAWARVLRARAEAVAAGGLAGSAAYAMGETRIAAYGELRSLLGMDPKIAARFAGVTGGGGDRTYYAERSLTQGHTSFALGVLDSAQGASAWQIVDCTYYTADTYFMSADLYCLWPWEGGTLVWQVDCVSAPFRGYTAGLDKVFAGREMIKETGKSIETFRKTVEP